MDTLPLSVNLMALDNRLFPTCRMRSLSVRTTASVWLSTIKVSPLLMAIGINSDSRMCVIAEILQCDKFGCSLPLSSRKKSSNVLSISRIRLEDCWMFRIYIPVLSVSLSFSINPAYPVIAVSGVRSSCVMVCTAFLREAISASFCSTDCCNCPIKSVVFLLYRLMLLALRCMMIYEITNSRRTNPVKHPTCINDCSRMAVISSSRFCKSACTFLSIWWINPCSCRLSSAFRAARLSACSDRRRLCACCSAIMSRLRERSIVVVTVGFGFSFLPKMPRNPLRFGFCGCSCTLFCTITGT